MAPRRARGARNRRGQPGSARPWSYTSLDGGGTALAGPSEPPGALSPASSDSDAREGVAGVGPDGYDWLPMGGPATLMPEVEAERWASELESFAEERDKRIDLRAARAAREARQLAASIRDVGREIRDARLTDDVASTGILLENLGSLRKRALDMLGAART